MKFPLTNHANFIVELSILIFFNSGFFKAIYERTDFFSRRLIEKIFALLGYLVSLQYFFKFSIFIINLAFISHIWAPFLRLYKTSNYFINRKIFHPKYRSVFACLSSLKINTLIRQLGLFVSF